MSAFLGRGERSPIRKDERALRGWRDSEPGYPGDLTPAQIIGGTLQDFGAKLLLGSEIDVAQVQLLPPIANPAKIVCIGLNYTDHSAESGYVVPQFPTIFARFESSLIGANAPLIRPLVSDQFDYEAELAVVIGRGGRYIAPGEALAHVLGYSIFNDASLRDIQLRTPQWTMGKNFDGTGAFGPWLVSPEDLPAGCGGLGIRTRLNGSIVQSAAIDDMVFDVKTLISEISQTLTLQPGDVIVSGTPSGVGMARKPPLWMKSGDVCEVEIDQIGTLKNPVVDESLIRSAPLA